MNALICLRVALDMLISRLCVNEIRVTASSIGAPFRIRLAGEAFDRICRSDRDMTNNAPITGAAIRTLVDAFRLSQY